MDPAGGSLTILDLGTFLRVDATRFDRIDDGSICGVRDSMAIGPYVGFASLACQVKRVVELDQVGFLECWLDPQLSILDKDVLVRVRGLFKLTIADDVLTHNVKWALALRTRNLQPTPLWTTHSR